MECSQKKQQFIFNDSRENQKYVKKKGPCPFIFKHKNPLERREIYFYTIKLLKSCRTAIDVLY